MDKTEQKKNKLSDAELGKKLREGRERAQAKPRVKKTIEQKEAEAKEKYFNLKAFGICQKIRDMLKGETSYNSKLANIVALLENEGVISTTSDDEETKEGN